MLVACCLTSLTPPEQAARLNDKVVSANLSWFTARRKIDTYFSLLRCSLKCDIINCSSSPLFFIFSLVWRFKALGHRDHWEGLSQCQWSSSDCLWSLEFYSAEGGKKMTWNPGLSHCQRRKNRTEKDAWGGLSECFEQFSFSWDLSGYSGPCDPTFQSLSSFSVSQPLTHRGTLTHTVEDRLCASLLLSPC